MPATVPAFDHVFFLYMENQWYPQIIGNTAEAPYLNRLASANGLAANYYALAHPSDLNYVTQAGGSDFGLSRNAVNSYPIDARNLADLIEESGRSWKQYMEDADGPCDRNKHGYYYPDDGPFLYFDDIRNDPARCAAHLVPLTQMATDLAQVATTPSYAWIAPNDCSDMEGCGIAAGDAWLQRTLPILFDSPAWRQQNCLLIIAWDEDDYAHDQHVPAILVGPSVKPGYVSPVRYTHYSVLRTIEAAFGLPPLTRNDAYATVMNDFWR
jgi:hypothetical protein